MSDQCSHNPLDQMQAFLDLQVEEVRQHTKVVTPETLGRDYFLRIDKIAPEVFVPSMPRSAMKSENSTTARVTVAPTLLGCLIGYFRAEYDVVYSGGPQAGQDPFHGGYDISRLTFGLALRPDQALVSDANTSDEHWLVGYNEDHIEYVPKPAGKFFISAVTYLNTGGAARPQIKLALWLLNETEDLELTPTKSVQPGYYQLDVYWESLPKRDVTRADIISNLREVSREDWLKQKSFSADMLSLQEKPKYLAW